MIRSPLIRAAAERRGIRTDDVFITQYSPENDRVKLTHEGWTTDEFELERGDYASPCPTCGGTGREVPPTTAIEISPADE